MCCCWSESVFIWCVFKWVSFCQSDILTKVLIAEFQFDMWMVYFPIVHIQQPMGKNCKFYWKQGWLLIGWRHWGCVPESEYFHPEMKENLFFIPFHPVIFSFLKESYVIFWVNHHCNWLFKHNLLTGRFSLRNFLPVSSHMKQIVSYNKVHKIKVVGTLPLLSLSTTALLFLHSILLLTWACIETLSSRYWQNPPKAKYWK